MKELKKRPRRAQRTGQLPDDLAVDVAKVMLWGPLLNRWLQRGGPLLSSTPTRSLKPPSIVCADPPTGDSDAGVAPIAVRLLSLSLPLREFVMSISLPRRNTVAGFVFPKAWLPLLLW